MTAIEKIVELQKQENEYNILLKHQEIKARGELPTAYFDQKIEFIITPKKELHTITELNNWFRAFHKDAKFKKNEYWAGNNEFSKSPFRIDIPEQAFLCWKTQAPLDKRKLIAPTTYLREEISIDYTKEIESRIKVEDAYVCQELKKEKKLKEGEKEEFAFENQERKKGRIDRSISLNFRLGKEYLEYATIFSSIQITSGEKRARKLFSNS